MCHLWEPMRHWYRPLGFYLFMEVAAFVGNLALQAAGFKQATYMGITYFTRNFSPAPPQTAARDDSGSSTSEAPLVLLHGIGMGLIPYISLLFNMAATGEGVGANNERCKGLMLLEQHTTTHIDHQAMRTCISLTGKGGKVSGQRWRAWKL